jgi:transcriptional regulator with XRE-family HTH domain
MDRSRFLRQLYEVMADETQAAFARRLGVSASTLSRLRTGERNPGWRFIRALLREFPQVSMAEWGLLEGNPSAASKGEAGALLST